MTGIDRDIVLWLNGFVGEWPDLDSWLSHAAFIDLYKGALPVAVMWWAWFKGTGEERRTRRAHLVALVVAIVAGLGANRAIASALPHQPRPTQALGAEFTLPQGMYREAFSDLSAFPSDHAVMFVGLATGVLFVSRFAGAVLLLHALVVVLAPRVYLGLHWPSDIVVGGAFGAVVAWLAARPFVREPIARPLLRWEARHPQSFYPLLFLLAWQLCVLFDPVVKVAVFFFKGGGH